MFTHTLRDRHDSPRYNNTTKTSTNNNLDNSKSHFQQPPVAELLVVLEKALLLPQVWKSLCTALGLEKDCVPSLFWKSQKWQLQMALKIRTGGP